ncbi:MAG: hypothetical protein HKP61_16390 [Dactylosporangium sp.]|nr:hypothetical protein [Dactylosporangium sp.]NNJ62486.1 hypothetical protein [Dactylosporangium sp.]
MWGDRSRRAEQAAQARLAAEVAAIPGSGLAGRTVTEDPPVWAEPAATLGGHPGQIAAMAFSPDGRWLATADDRDTTILWDVTTPDRPLRIQSISPRAPAAAEQSATVPWRYRQPLSFHGKYRPGRSVTFGPDGRVLAAGLTSGLILLWDVTDPTHPAQIAVLHRPRSGWAGRWTGSARSVAFSPDGQTLVAGYDVWSATWDLGDSHRPPRASTLLKGVPINAVGFSQQGVLAVGGHRGGLRPLVVWSAAKPPQPRFVAKPRVAHLSQWKGRGVSSVLSLAFSPGRRLLATACEHQYDVSDEHVWVPASHDGNVILWDLTYPSYPARLATLTQRGGIRMDAGRWQRRWQPTTFLGHAGQVRSVAFSNDGHILATASDDEDVLLWNVTDSLRPRCLARVPHQRPVHTIAFSPTSRVLATGGAEALLWVVP